VTDLAGGPHLTMIDGFWHAGPCLTCGGAHRVTDYKVGDGHLDGHKLVIPISVCVEPCDQIVVTLTITKETL